MKPNYFIALGLCHDVDPPLHVGSHDVAGLGHDALGQQCDLARQLGPRLLRLVLITCDAVPSLACFPQTTFLNAQCFRTARQKNNHPKTAPRPTTHLK